MLCKMQMITVWLFVFAGLFSLSQCVQNSSNTDNRNSPTNAAAEGIKSDNDVTAGISSRSAKAISFFPTEEATDQSNLPAPRQEAARRIRFGADEDTNYVNSISNDIGGSTVEIGERRPAVSAYKRPDDGAIYNASPNNNNNYYSRQYEYSYDNQGQYYNPQQSPQYYSQTQQGNYYRPQRPQQQPVTRPSPPTSQTYHHIPYPQSQAYQQPQRQQQQQQKPYQQQYPYSPGPPPQGPYYQQQQQQQQRPPQGIYNYSPQQYENYSPNYPYADESDGGPGGILGGLGSLFSGGGGGGGFGGGQQANGGVGNQFGYAIENIVRYDDYQCVPKIVCQMVGNPQRQSTLPSWLNAPSLTALISAVPSTSPMLVFGRAALLGLSGGESNCDSSYPRCPRNEDDVLSYLNNHRGGFFRFFNGGANYGDIEDTDYGYDQQQGQQPQYQQQQYQQQQYQQPNQQYQQPNQQYQQQQNQPLYQQPQQPQTQNIPGLDLGTLSSLAEAINQGGGINLSNLGSNLGLLGNLASLGSALGAVTGGGAGSTAAVPQKQSTTSNLGANLSLLSGLGSQLGLGDTVSNLLSGLVGQRFKGRRARKLSKRSAEFTESSIPDDSLDELLLTLGKDANVEDGESTEPPSKKRNLNKEIGDDATQMDNAEKLSWLKRKKYHQDEEKKEKIRQVEKILGVQARIINKKEIEAEADARIVNGNGNFALNTDSLLLNPIIFPDDYATPNSVNLTPLPGQGLFFPTHSQDTRTGHHLGHSFVFPHGLRQQLDDNRGGKAFQFSHSTVQSVPSNVPYNPLQFPETFQNNDGIILDIPKPLPLEYYDHTKMIFPDRTGTGNLRFDNEELFQNQKKHLLGQNLIRIGRILTGANQNRPVSYQGSYNANHGSSAANFNRGDVLVFHNNREDYQNNNFGQRPQYDFGNRYPLSDNVNNNRYQGGEGGGLTYNRPSSSSTDYYGDRNRYQSTSSSSSSSNQNNGGKVYVTNAQGIVTYYLNERGEKIAV